MRIAECGLRNEKLDGIQDADCESPTPNSERSLPSKVVIGGAPNSNGFTLVEIIITIVLIGILAGVAAMIIVQGVRVYSEEQVRSDVHYQARIAIERMAREIRMIRSATAADITNMTNNNLQFADITNAAVNYNFANPNIQRNGINLATGITAFTFSYFQQDGVTAALIPTALWFVEITMTSQQGNESIQMRTRVHPRNF